MLQFLSKVILKFKCHSLHITKVLKLTYLNQIIERLRIMIYLLNITLYQIFLYFHVLLLIFCIEAYTIISLYFCCRTFLFQFFKPWTKCGDSSKPNFIQFSASVSCVVWHDVCKKGKGHFCNISKKKKNEILLENSNLEHDHQYSRRK